MPQKKPEPELSIPEAVDYAGQKFRVPRGLRHAIIGHESNYDPTADNPASSAYGPGQIIESTGRQLGIDRTDPVENIVGSMKLLRDEFDYFRPKAKDDADAWAKSVGAYFKGRSHIEKYGFTGEDAQGTTTQSYITNVLSRWADYGEPDVDWEGGEKVTSEVKPYEPEPLKPLAFDPDDDAELNRMARTSLSLSQSASMAGYNLPNTHPALLGKTLAVTFDHQPSFDEVEYAMLEKLGKGYGDLAAQFRAETGKSLVENSVGLTQNPDGSWRAASRPTRGFIDAVNAYAKGGLPAYNGTLGQQIVGQRLFARDLQAAIDADKGVRSDLAATGARAYTDTAQTAQNMLNLLQAVPNPSNPTAIFDAPDPTTEPNAQAIAAARANIPRSETVVGRLADIGVGAAGTIAQATAMGGNLPLQQAVQNVQAGPEAAFKAGIMVAPVVAMPLIGRAAGIDATMSGAARQATLRTLGAGTQASQAAMMGAEPWEILEQTAVGGAFPVGRRTQTEGVPRRPLGIERATVDAVPEVAAEPVAPPPIAADIREAATAAPPPRTFVHKDFGKVTEVKAAGTNATGKRMVIVRDEQGQLHRVQDVQQTGRGNQRMIPERREFTPNMVVEGQQVRASLTPEGDFEIELRNGQRRTIPADQVDQVQYSKLRHETLMAEVDAAIKAGDDATLSEIVRTAGLSDAELSVEKGRRNYATKQAGIVSETPTESGREGATTAVTERRGAGADNQAAVGTAEQVNPPQGEGVAKAAKIVLEPPDSVLAQLNFGKEQPVDTQRGIYKTTTARGKEYSFDLHVYKLADGRERLVLSAGNPKELIDAGAIVRPVEGGVVIETLHGGSTGFKNLGGILARQITKRYGKVIPDTEAPLSPAGRKATEKLAAKQLTEGTPPVQPETPPAAPETPSGVGEGIKPRTEMAEGREPPLTTSPTTATLDGKTYTLDSTGRWRRGSDGKAVGGVTLERINESIAASRQGGPTEPAAPLPTAVNAAQRPVPEGEAGTPSPAQKVRQFPETLRESGRPVPSQEYTPQTHAAALDIANARIRAQGLDETFRKLRETAEVGGEDTATAIRLIDDYYAAGKSDKALEVADFYAPRLTKSGQAGSAAAIAERLTPAHQVMMLSKMAARDPTARANLTDEVVRSTVETASKLRDIEDRVAVIEEMLARANASIDPVTTRGQRAFRARAQSWQKALDAEAEAARQRLAARTGVSGSEAGASTIPLDIADYAIIGAAKFAKTSISLGEWTAEMVAEFGEQIRPQIQKIYVASWQLYKDRQQEAKRASAERAVTGGEPEAFTREQIDQLLKQRELAMKEQRQHRAEMGRVFNDLNKTRGEKIASRAVSYLSVPQTALTSGDISFAGRQGILFDLTEPKAAAEAFVKQIQSFNDAQHQKFIAEIKSDAAYADGVHYGLRLTSEGLRGDTGIEEPFRGRQAIESIPVLGRPLNYIVRKSEQAYTTFGDYARLYWWKKLSMLIRENPAIKDPERELYKLADFINNALGRFEGSPHSGWKGYRQAFEQTAQYMPFFSPRFWQSRLWILNASLNPVNIAKGIAQPGAQRIILQKTWQAYGELAGFMALARAGGAEVNYTDPEKSDFLKLRMGDTRYDLTGGLQNHVRFMGRMAPLMKAYGDALAAGNNAEANEIAKQGAKIIGNYAQYKLAPVPSTLVSLGEGKFPDQEAFTWQGAGVRAVTPLIFQDMYEGWKAAGGIGVLKSTPTIIGIGVDTYSDDRRPKSPPRPPPPKPPKRRY